VHEQAVDGAALALEGPDDLGGELVDVVGTERGEQGLETVQQRVEVQGGLGARQRDRGPWLQPGAVARALGQGDVTLADEVPVADDRAGAVQQRTVRADREGDLRKGPVLDPDALDLAPRPPGCRRPSPVR
jgi:hypothetical protein